jgi:IS30 family transposase
MTKPTSFRLTFEERSSIEDALKSGYYLKDLARDLGRGYCTIRREVYRNSVNGKYRAKVAQRLADERAANMARCDDPNKRFLTLAERRRIESLLRRGISVYRIARELGRNQSALNREVMVNGGHDNYQAAEAHRRASRRFGSD